MSLLRVGRLLRGDCHRVALRQAGASKPLWAAGETPNPKPQTPFRLLGGGGCFRCRVSLVGC